MKVSIRLKTMLGTAAIEAILLSVLIFVSMSFMLDSANEALNKRASTTVKLFASATKDAVLSFDLATLDTFTAELLTNPDILYVRVLSSDKKLLSYAGPDDIRLASFQSDQHVDAVDDGVFDATANITEGDVIFGVVELGIDIGTITKAINEVKKWTVSIALFDMVLVAIFSYVLGVYLTKNLYFLRNTAIRITNNIKHNQYDYHVEPILSQDELEALSVAFVELSDALVEEHQRRTEYEKKLLEMNEHLEHQVEKRTEKLQEQNLQLVTTYQELAATQEQLIQSEKMASVGQLAAGVAHEINNPLGFVMSNLNALEDYIGDYQEACQLVKSYSIDENKELDNKKNQDKSAGALLPPEIEEHFKTMDFDYLVEDCNDIIAESLDGLNRVSEIVKNLKQFSRVTQVEMQECNLHECINTALKMINNDLHSTQNITVNFSDLPPVTANMGKLVQMFSSLFTNSIQAIDSDGVITASAKTADNNVLIEVSDNGKGIPSDVIDKIFDPFFTTKPIGQGTGLGLTTCYDIVKEHGGDISAVSEEGVGTTIHIRLPITPNMSRELD